MEAYDHPLFEEKNKISVIKTNKNLHLRLLSLLHHVLFRDHGRIEWVHDIIVHIQLCRQLTQVFP